MSLNDRNFDEFSSELQDEYGFDAHPPPGTEVLGLQIQHDQGSGSYAEDGREEIWEGDVMANGETMTSAIGAGLASEEGQTEIGAGLASQDGQSEIGWGGADWDSEGTLREGADQHLLGSAAMYGPSEIGSAAEHGFSEIGAGLASEEGQSEIGTLYSEEGASEIGTLYSEEGASEIGTLYSEEGASEIGGVNPEHETPFESFMEEETRLGEEGYGLYPVDGASEIGAAVAKTIEKARDNRQPPPPMTVLDENAPDSGLHEDFGLMDVVIGAAAATGHPDPFPRTSEFMQRCGSGMEPRYVRVDTEESYKQFRAEHSPEMSELRARVDELAEKLNQHVTNPYAHDEIEDDVADLTVLGEAVKVAEEDKRVELWMPQHFEGKLEAWREGDFVCASMALPSLNGEVRICTSLEPVRKCVTEMSHHAAEAGVSPSVIGGSLPAMGCVLGAGTIMKEVAASAPGIMARPEMARRKPFVVRVEPKSNPALCALAMLVMACRAGDQQACDEWANLGKLSPAPLQQAMQEAVQLAKAAVGA